MPASNQKYGPCPIWPQHHPTLLLSKVDPDIITVEQSLRAGGNYQITGPATYDIQDLNESQRTRLTTILVDKRNEGCEWPLVILDLLEQAKNRASLSDEERAARLLRFMAKKTESLGDLIIVNESTHEAYAWTESIKWSEVHFLLKHLYANKLIEGDLTETEFEGVITWEGRRYVVPNTD